MPRKIAGGYYAVGRGKKVGIFSTWAECEEQVKGFPGAKFKKFQTCQEAEAFVKQWSSSCSSSNATQLSNPDPSVAPCKSTNQPGTSFNRQTENGQSSNEVSVDEQVHILSETFSKRVPAPNTQLLNISVDLNPAKRLQTNNSTTEACKSTNQPGTSFNRQTENGQSSLKRPHSSDSNEVSVDEQIQILRETFSKRVPAPSTQRNVSVDVNPAKRLHTDNSTTKVRVSEDGSVTYLPFIMDSYGFVNVYTDGACRKNGRKTARAGVGVWFGDNHPLNISRPVIGPATNNNAEIQAAWIAIEIAAEAGFKKLKVNTDSQFLIQCATKWLKNWKRKGWKLANGENVKNRVQLEKLDRALSLITVQWNKVPAHVGIHGNEMADKLANDGASRYMPH